MKNYVALLMVGLCLCCQSCYNYRVATKALPATDAHYKKINSYCWGLVQQPQFITTDNCDSMEVNGVAEVIFKTSFGHALITVGTLGIWAPAVIEWRCSKPCQQQGEL